MAEQQVGRITFSPGPWRVEKLRQSVMVSAETGGMAVIVSEIGRNVNSQDLANARLIAAAPDLLAALKRLLHECSPTRKDWHLEVTTDGKEQAKAAIAKAEGR